MPLSPPIYMYKVKFGRYQVMQPFSIGELKKHPNTVIIPPSFLHFLRKQQQFGKDICLNNI